jgi:peptidoglycan/xylan/chitin deacetylase (PgdA/CDA1 family)
MAQIRSGTLAVDRAFANACLPFCRERGTLLSFVFHGLFLDDELKTETADPQQRTTSGMLRSLLKHFKERGYNFIGPPEILRGLRLDDKCVLITFDDGYYNNLRALPVLEEFEAPAVFFVSTDHIKQGKAYWWDVVFRKFKQQGRSDTSIRRAVAGFKRLRTEDIERSLEKEFGKHAIEPVGDVDRPFTPSELSRLANHRLAFVGNHTQNHAILTNYSAREVKQQIQRAQDDILAITGRTPNMIAYPNGNYSQQILEIARQSGVLLGVTAEPGKNRLPLDPKRQAMHIKRFVLWGDQAVNGQCRVCRSLSLRHAFTRFKMRRRAEGKELA